ncbi:MAG: carboxylesterase family protein [Spirochaetaceae bacterium]|jgi:para-nitrobenzyl esterase|nr:carboxylesterase family protein [Spirochaetaceae bacterium]
MENFSAETPVYCTADPGGPPAAAIHSAAQRARHLIAYSNFSAGSKFFADTLARDNNPVFMYNFNFLIPDDPLAALLGVYHTAELPYVFNSVGINGKENKKLVQEMHSRWINFIKTGDPNLGIALPSAAPWPRYYPAQPEALCFDHAVSPSPLPDKKNLNFMIELLYGINN